VNGGQVRNTRILLVPHHEIAGYDQRQVDDLLLRVAAELDARRPAGPLIENAAFRIRTYRKRYDIDAVDWLLGQLSLPVACTELTEISAGPWRDLAVSQLASGEVSGDADRHRHGRAGRQQGGEYFVQRCENAWRDFGQLPGTHLRWGKTGRGLSELRNADRQTLASARYSLFKTTVSMGGKSFTFKAVSAGGIRINLPQGTAQPTPPGTGEFYARVSRDAFGRYRENLSGLIPWQKGVKVEELADETGAPALYTCGRNFDWRAHASVMFPDQRQLRFLVRGTERSHAIMTAVDQAGHGVARYRISGKATTEIAVNPGWKLTDELALAIAISAPWLDSYFERPGGGG
jgi:hypothetical protein